MHVVIFGAGAVGGFYGARLQQAGAQVTFVARGATANVLKQQGLHIIQATPQPQDITLKVQVVEDIAEVVSADVVLYTPKITGTPHLPQLPEGAFLALTQNAVEIPQIAAAQYGAQRVYPGVVRAFLSRKAPGVVEHSGQVLRYNFGALAPESGLYDAKAQAFCDAMNSAGIDTVLDPHIMVDLWEKAMFVNCFGGLGAFVQKPLGEVRTTYRVELAALMQEVAAIARAQDIALSDDVVARTLAFADHQPATATSSMQRDLQSGHPSELEAQIGAMVRLSQRYQVAAPHFHQLYDALCSTNRMMSS